MSHDTSRQAGPRLIVSQPTSNRRALVGGLTLGALALAPVRAFAQTPTGAYGGGGGDEVTADVANRLFASVFNDHAEDVCREIVTDGVISITPEGVFRGPDGVLKSMERLWLAFPNARFTILERFDANGTATLHWSLTGIHFGDFEGLAATGAAVTFEGISLVQVQRLRVPEHHWQFDERISRHNMAYDRMGLLEKLRNPVVIPFDQPHPLPF